MRRSTVAQLVFVMLASFQFLAQGKERPVEHPTFYRTIQIDGLSIFYKEAGPKDAPTILLLHGLPSSSRMFEPLFDRLSDRYHLSRPIILASDTVISLTRKNLRTRSIASPKS